jgi:energy-coupling factor transporter ATP-binding protein EcfA2
MSKSSRVAKFPGATFVRADLHVHTHGDSDESPTPDLDAYIKAAVASGIDLMAITDHNSVAFVRDAMKAAEGQPLVVIPGIEISTQDGHLLALFAPEHIEALESFATSENLKLRKLSATEKRSDRSMLDLVGEIAEKGGLAIPAHVDVDNGMCAQLRQSKLVDLLSNPALAGIEFAKSESLDTWFTDGDDNPDRVAAWKARQKDPVLRGRGLARLMSSDAHSPDKVGRDRAARTLTRLRLDEPNFAALRNAILFNPKARCKAEAILPAAYPRILNASFKGGFLDGVCMDFTGNLNCLIGGRGSGKSTALLSIRAALGAEPAKGEDPDDPHRMPDITTVAFIDSAGSERVAVRYRGQQPVDGDGSPIRLRMADLGQDESGELARGYQDDPTVLLRFLDDFIVRHDFDERETDLLAQLEANSAEVKRTSGIAVQIKKYETEEATLEGSLKAAKEGRIDEIAKWAAQLASQKPLLEDLRSRLEETLSASAVEAIADLDALAAEFGVDLAARPAVEFVGGEKGLRTLLADFDTRRAAISARAATEITAAAKDVNASLDSWKSNQTELEVRLEAKRTELEAQGLKVQAGAIVAIATRLNEVKTQLTALRRKRDDHTTARKERTKVLDALHENRERLYLAREATLKRIASAANAYADGLTIHVFFERCGIDNAWVGWLSAHFGFKKPRVSRLACLVSPDDFARRLLADRASLVSLKDDQDGSAFFTDEMLKDATTWPNIFELETMRREDRPRIEVQRHGVAVRQPFDHLSTGQQRSVLLSLLLCAERNEPLVLDQPEDHLDGQYIATAVVRHLEAAKERRQVLIATHSANLAVLGDAELIIPMQVVDGHGRPYAVGAVDRAETRDEVLALLEGGAAAYKKRGQRYGFHFAPTSPDVDA